MMLNLPPTTSREGPGHCRDPRASPGPREFSRRQHMIERVMLNGGWCGWTARSDCGAEVVLASGPAPLGLHPALVVALEPLNPQHLDAGDADR